MTPTRCVDWLFGRGLSIGCGLSWSVPAEWSGIPRDEKIARIKHVLRQEMDSQSVDCNLIRQFLGLLKRHTVAGWRHQFITTNWDYLLQREILNLQLKVQPSWLANSHVYHLNGTVENLPDNSNRSQFLLEEDPASQRTLTPEANVAYNFMIVHRVFVVAGMSFECDTDKFLLQALGRVEDDMPIGESTWMVVNPDKGALDRSCSGISAALPNAQVHGIATTLGRWFDDKLPELQQCGAIAF